MRALLLLAALAAVAAVPPAWASPEPLSVPVSAAGEPPASYPDMSILTLKSQTLHGAMEPSERPHRLVVWCTGDALVYSLRLHVPGEGARYTIAADSARLDGVAMDHPYYSQNGDVKMEAVGSGPLRLGAGAFPLALGEHGSLMIPIESSGLQSAVRITVDMLYVAGSQTVCRADEFEPGPVAALFPAGDDFGGFGAIMLKATRAGVADFNAHLSGIGEDWRMELAEHDTRGGNVTALVDSALDGGAALYLGPPDVLGLGYMPQFGGDLVALSCCGTSSFLERDDNVFRTAPSDSKLAGALARLMAHNGIGVLVPVWVDDPWNNSYVSDVVKSFEALGGAADAGVMQESGKSLGELGGQIRERIASLAETHGPERVAVFSLPVDDAAFMRAMSAHDGVDQVRWFGTDYTAKDFHYTGDPSIREFASATGYTALQVEAVGARAQSVLQNLTLATGKAGNHDMLAAYESARILGLAVQQAQSTDPSRIADVIPYVAARHAGTMGPMAMDGNGDLASPSFEVWSVHGGEWVLAGTMR